MAVSPTDVLSVVKLRLGDDGQDELIKTYIDEIGQRILHYCNLTEMPDGLKLTWSSMTIDALRIEQPNLEGVEQTTAESESVTVGDTSTAPAKSAGLTNAAKSVIDQVVLNYRVDLNRYRKVRW